MDKTQLLDNRDEAHLDLAVELMARGEIVAFGWNGIFVFLGEADQEMAAWRIAAAKRQSLAKPLALVCAPEYLEEFVDLEAPVFRYHPFDRVQRLQREVHSLGVILPARTGLPPYMTHKGTILNVWMGVSASPACPLFTRPAPPTRGAGFNRQFGQPARRADLYRPVAGSARLWGYHPGNS